MGQNYFNTLPLRLQLEQLGQCRFMHACLLYTSDAADEL